MTKLVKKIFMVNGDISLENDDGILFWVIITPKGQKMERYCFNTRKQANQFFNEMQYRLR